LSRVYEEVIKEAFEKALKRGKVTEKTLEQEFRKAFKKAALSKGIDEKSAESLARLKAIETRSSFVRIAKAYRVFKDLIDKGVIKENELKAFAVFGSAVKGTASEKKLKEKALYIGIPTERRLILTGISKITFAPSDVDLMLVLKDSVPLKKRRRVFEFISRKLNQKDSIIIVDEKALKSKKKEHAAIYTSPKLFMKGKEVMGNYSKEEKESLKRFYLRNVFPVIAAKKEMSKKEISKGKYFGLIHEPEKVIYSEKLQPLFKAVYKALEPMQSVRKEVQLRRGIGKKRKKK